MRYLLLVAAIFIAACGDSRPVVSERTQVQPVLETHWAASEEALRVRVDKARNRVWVLGLDYVDVYDTSTKHLLRHVELPQWSVADFICQPDMALDSSGTAFISHNLQPRLWQIDTDTFQLKEHVIRLVGRERWDIGFGSLAFTPDGTLFGVTASGESLWSIDVANASAHQVEFSPLDSSCVSSEPSPVLLRPVMWSLGL